MKKKELDRKFMAMLATAEVTRDQLSWLTRDQLSWLTGDQLSWLTRDQLRGLTRDQLSWLTRDQLSWLTRDQLSWLTGEGVPVVKSLYSQIYRDIQSELRSVDQSTFGPDSDPGENLCKTPMCIAGHTVNLAGSDGYALAAKVGFATAAALIHRASCPDAPMPRYDSYPNAWAMAYIEERASTESDANA